MTRSLSDTKILFRMIDFNDSKLSDGGEINAKQFFRDLDFPPLNLW